MGGSLLLAGAPLLLLCRLSADFDSIMDDDASIWLRADIVLLFCGTTNINLCYYYSTARARDDMSRPCRTTASSYRKTVLSARNPNAVH